MQWQPVKGAGQCNPQTEMGPNPQTFFFLGDFLVLAWPEMLPLQSVCCLFYILFTHSIQALYSIENIIVLSILPCIVYVYGVCYPLSIGVP